MEGRGYSLRLGVRAQQQVRAATRWYRRQDPRLSARFVAAVRGALPGLREAPLRWAEFEPGYRRARVRGFPFAVIYTVVGDEVLVIAVLHDRRGPEARRFTGPGGG